MEKLTNELQQKKAARIAKTGTIAGTGIPTDAASEASTAVTAPPKEDDAQSVQSFASESYVMAQREGEERPAKKSRGKLWDEIKISCMPEQSVLLLTLGMADRVLQPWLGPLRSYIPSHS